MIIALALILRLVILATNTPTPENTLTRLNDPTDYDHLARMILQGKYCAPGGEPTAFRPPVYPAFMAVVYLFAGKGNLLAVGIFQAILGGLNAFLALKLARRMTGSRAASLLAGFLTAAYPAFVLQSAQILTEVLFRTFYLSGLLFLVSGLEKNRGRYKAVAGLLLGLAILTKSALLAAVPFLLIWLACVGAGSFRQSLLKSMVPFALSLFCVIGTWTARNVLISDTLIPVSSNFRITFAHGVTRFCYYANAWYGEEPLMEVPDHYQELTQLRFYNGVKEEIATGRKYARKAVAYMGENPWFVLRLTLRKILHFWSPLIRNTLLKRLLAIFSMGPVLLFGWIGILWGLKEGGRPRSYAVLALVLALPVSIPYILSQPDIRYRLSVVDALWIITASRILVVLFQRVQTSLPGESIDPARSEACDGSGRTGEA